MNVALNMVRQQIPLYAAFAASPGLFSIQHSPQLTSQAHFTTGTSTAWQLDIEKNVNICRG